VSQQTYPVKCECGVVHQCPAGYAGSRFACKCGKQVEVPVLSELRASMGERALTPEVEIAALMAAKTLPVEPDCCLCGCETSDTLMLLAVCETPESPSVAGKVAKSGCLIPFIGLWGWVALAISLRDASNAAPIGRRVEVRFPLRMCAECAAEVASWDVIRDVMNRTPIYRRLLKRYPECRLSTVKSL
jgi:hypothetical protein